MKFKRVTLVTINRLAKFIVSLSLFIAIAFAVQQGFFEHIADSNWVAKFVNEQGKQAVVVLMAMGAAYAALGAPRQLLAFAFGFAFGAVEGALLALVATELGCILSFYAAKWLFRSSLQRKFNKSLMKFERLVKDNTTLKVLMIRLLPIGSNLFTNVAAGATTVPAQGFFLGSFIGYIPQTLIFAYAGAGIGLSEHEKILISIALFIVSSVIGSLLYRSQFRRKVQEL
ncbi:MAG: VTT domain-containing protein [Pseudoalteromonas distincta]